MVFSLEKTTIKLFLNPILLTLMAFLTDMECVKIFDMEDFTVTD